MRGRVVLYAVVLVAALGAGALAQAPSAQLPYPAMGEWSDSLLTDPGADTTVAGADSAGAKGSAPALSKIDVVRRDFTYRRQVGMALGMMAFLALIFTTTQNWNPK